MRHSEMGGLPGRDRQLGSVYADACEASEHPGAAKHRSALEARCRAIVEGCRDAGCRFGTTLENAVPHLFTFLEYPGMDPTNNESERPMRIPVMSRKMRQRIEGAKGMEVFSTLSTCFLTWEKCGLSLEEEIARLY